MKTFYEDFRYSYSIEKGENLTEKNLGFMVRFYGYQSLEEAEQMQK